MEADHQPFLSSNKDHSMKDRKGNLYLLYLRGECYLPLLQQIDKDFIFEKTSGTKRILFFK